MRIKDEVKQEALFEATVKLVNEIGFASSSVSKIAKEAGVSPATIYVYYRNKEDLLVSTYVEIKRDLSRAILEGFDRDRPIRDIFRQLWFNMFAHIAKHPDYFQFTEQFANSPYCSLVDRAALDKYYKPIEEIFIKGITQKIIKDVNRDILITFVFHPVVTLSNPRMCQDFELTESNIETAFNLAWDAIKL